MAKDCLEIFDKIINMVKNNWNEIYKRGGIFDYYDMLKPHSDMARIIRLFKKRDIKKVLDIGCGLGNNLIPLMENDFEVAGIDMSADAIQKFKKSLDKIHKEISLKVAPFEELPYKDGEFDGVICVQTLSHGKTKNIKKGIEEILRVLRKGGVAFLTVPGRVAKGKVRYCLVKTATKIEDCVYVPTIGPEIGISHFIFSKDVIRSLFKKFKIEEIGRDYNDYYSIIISKRS